ncbi:MAG: hypothetical protein BAJALOKI2v1_290026 [Promethearchaeota archaeon]|nr:MAG: hypothetical protein BAJALOKI2v1_290026 [Candidatus Lokiarchaeota archaeon]
MGKLMVIMRLIQTLSTISLVFIATVFGFILLILIIYKLLHYNVENERKSTDIPEFIENKKSYTIPPKPVESTQSKEHWYPQDWRKIGNRSIETKKDVKQEHWYPQDWRKIGNRSIETKKDVKQEHWYPQDWRTIGKKETQNEVKESERNKETSDLNYCSACGNKVRPNAFFCTYCGNEL